jgi:hypothetical protein
MKMFMPIHNAKDKLIAAAHSKIRERAISRTKSKIALQGKNLSDYRPDHIEDIVAEEQLELLSQLKAKSLLALVAFLGFGVI